MLNDKIATMLGFAMRSGKAVYGVDNIPKARHVGVILIGSDISANSIERLKRQNENVTIVMSLFPLESITKFGCKAIAVTDKNMSREILRNINENYRIISEDK